MQTYENKMHQGKQILLNASCKLHFGCKFVPRSVGDSFLHLARQPLMFFENHKNQVDACLGAAGRNAQDLKGVLRSADVRFAITDLCFGFDTSALAYGKGGGSLRAFRLACCGQWAIGNGRYKKKSKRCP